VAWSTTYIKRAAPAKLVIVACLPSKTGGFMATAEVQPLEPPPAFVEEMAGLMVRMLAAAATSPGDDGSAAPAVPGAASPADPGLRVQ
jgi:hypothetical protein